MFTGIITGVGRIVSVKDLGKTSLHGKRIAVEVPPGYLDDVSLGDSIALNGACMTVVSVQLPENCFTIDLSAESFQRTAQLATLGSAINLEKALRAHDRLGGHVVSGHVDGVGTVTHFQSVGESWDLRIRAPQSLARYLAYKGSVAVNGVSLTVNKVIDSEAGPEIYINLIPHTLQHTALHTLLEGAAVNLEIDTVARYVERMVTVGVAVPVDPSFVAPHL